MYRLLAVAALVFIALGALVSFLLLGGEDVGAPDRIETERTERIEQGAASSIEGPLDPDPGDTRVELGEAAVESEPGPEQEAAEPVVRPALVGRVLFAETRAPYAEKLLAVWDPAGFHRLTTDADGRFSEVEVLAGPYRFAVGDDEGSALGWKLARDRFELVPRGDDVPLELELLVELARRFLEVEVVPPPGRDEPCVVSFASVGSFIRTRKWQQGMGNVRFGYRSDELESELMLWATNDVGDFSEFLSLESAQLPAFVRLDLVAGAAVDMRLWTHAGEVAGGVRVLLMPRHGMAAMRGGSPKVTDDEGRVSFEGLPACETDVSILGADGAYTTYERLNLLPGRRTALDITLQPPISLAVSGVVLDEEGAPLAQRVIVVQPQGIPRHWEQGVSSKKDGTFSLHTPECEAVLVSANLDPRGDVFEPAVIRAEHGAKDLVFRRVSTAVERSFTIAAIDTATGDPIGDVVATFDRGPPGRRWSNTYAPRTHFTVHVQADTRMRVGAHGYRSVSLQLAETLAQLAGDAPVRVELKPGLHMRLRVFDLTTDAPVAGVVFHAPSGHEALSDEGGWVEIETEQWSIYNVEKAGYVSEECDPADFVLFDAHEVFLLPEGVEDR